MLVEWTGPADAEARYASSRRADVPELASTGMKRDQLLESGLTSPLLSHVQRRFPTLHEFRGKPWQGGCPQPLTAHDNGGPHGLPATTAHAAPRRSGGAFTDT